jgi:quercetin dioxygenase-like cupin family protein
VSDYLVKPAAQARFATERYTKTDLARGAHFFLGLNCFMPGQSQAAHTHASADKFYLVLSGKARMVVGHELIVAEPGDLVWCPAGVEHGVDAALDQCVMVVGISKDSVPGT